MSFYVYARANFDFTHEIQQCQTILDDLKSLYADKNDDYCFCLLNVLLFDNNKNPRRQFDIIICTRNSISTIELKAKAGKLSGRIDKSYGNSSILMTYPNGQNEEIKIQQIESQQKDLKAIFAGGFRKRMRKSQEEKYRIDSYLVFRNETNFDEVKIENPQIAKWLRLTTENSFLASWRNTNRDQPFTLTEDDICYIAESRFRLHEVDPDDFSVSIGYISNRIRDFVGIQEREVYNRYTYETLKKSLLAKLTESEYRKLLSLFNNIASLNDNEKEQYRTLIWKADMPYISNKRIDHYFFGEALKPIQDIIIKTMGLFETVPKIVKPVSRENRLEPHTWLPVFSEGIEELRAKVDTIRITLDDYIYYYRNQVEEWGDITEEVRSFERVFLILRVCSKYEDGY